MSSEYAMPWCVLNMGTEMLYILDQRLHAQSIIPDKADRVLSDVIQTMFNTSFLNELFKAQRMYSAPQTRAVFDKLAHSSIMRLNTTSMDKLYDLMCMTTKLHWMTVASVTDLPDVVHNHLNALRKMTKSASAQQLIDTASQQVRSVFQNFTLYDYYVLRLSLARFYQDRRVKVSLLLQENLQTNDGNIIVRCDNVLPQHTDKPGSIRYYSKGRVVKEETVTLANAAAVTPYSATTKTDLGSNIYARDRKKKPSVMSSTVIPTTVKKVVDNNSTRTSTSNDTRSTAKGEMNLLANLIGTSSAVKANEKIDILSLFPSAQVTQSNGVRVESDVLTFDETDCSQRIQQLQAKMHELDMQEHKSNDDDDDLLDLMDRA